MDRVRISEVKEWIESNLHRAKSVKDVAIQFDVSVEVLSVRLQTFLDRKAHFLRDGLAV